MFGVLVGTGHRRSHLHGGASGIAISTSAPTTPRPIVFLDKTSRQVLAAWVAARTLDWRFTTENARITLKRLYRAHDD